MSSDGTTDERVSETLGLFVEAAGSGEEESLCVAEPLHLDSVPGVSAPVSTCVACETGADSEDGFCVVAVTSPTVSTDHPSLLAYVARRARARKSPYFLTCNLRDASLWATPKKGEEVSAATRLKNYIDIFQIESSAQTELDAQAQIALVERAREILDDLSGLSEDGQLGLVSVDADFFVHRLTQAVSVLAPIVQESLANSIKRDPKFRDTISDWAVLQGIPADVTSTEFSESLSRQIIYRLLGKIIFYQSLRRSARQLPALDLCDIDSSQVLPTLRRCFAKSLEVDYHAVFREDIVDAIPFPRAASQELAALVDDLNTRDFASLPQDVVGEVFERLIPPDERRSLGQYFTPEDLVDIIDAFCIRSADDSVLDPTCGTGTFLIRAYDRLQHLGRREHTRLLQQLWGVDIAPFPAELATINLFRQRLSEHGNFPLPGYEPPHEAIAEPFESADELRDAFEPAIAIRDKLRAEMIARQEEMDWLVYRAYGLIEEPETLGDDGDLRLEREQRPFCFWHRAEGDFEEAVRLIPVGWSDRKRRLWRRRLETIRDNEHVRRIERPVYKRRWDEQWKVGNSWQCGQPAYDQEFFDAFEWWLSEKAEWWLENKAAGGPVTLGDWRAAMWNGERVQAAWQVAAEAQHRLDLWKRKQKNNPTGSPPELDASRSAFNRYFKVLVREQSVPDNIPWAVPWDELEEQDVHVPTRTRRIRGKLNVPRERFWKTFDGNYRAVEVP